MNSAARFRPAALRPNQIAWERFRRNRPALINLVFLVAAVLVVTFLSLVSAPARGAPRPWLPAALQHPPNALSDAQFEPPGARHWFGTDVHGRDLLARVVSGARLSLLVGVVGAAVALVIGVGWGAVAGYAGGRWDALLMRVVDILYSLPSIILVMVLVSTLDSWVRAWLSLRLGRLGPALAAATPMLLLVVGLGAVSWLTMARIVRGQVLALREREFVTASRALGASPWRILRRHLLPHVYGIVLVYLTLTVPAIILYESFLSFLGLGIQPPLASWGTLIAEGAQQLNPIRTYWWLIVFPAGALVGTLLALSVVGDGLRDAWDPYVGHRAKL